MLECHHNAFEKALAVQRSASAMGFDWSVIEGVLEKVDEELQELRQALAEEDVHHARKELGDILFTAVSAARFLNADPGVCLSEATERFQKRMKVVFQIAQEEGIILPSCAEEALDALWMRAKKLISQ